MTCKDCIHYDVCHKRINSIDFLSVIKGRVSTSSIMYKNCDDVEKHCRHFKDKSRFVKLPCKVGDTFYAIVNNSIIAYNCVGFKYGHSAVTRKNNELLLLTVYDIEFVFGEEAFLSNEEAEAKLKELNND